MLLITIAIAGIAVYSARHQLQKYEAQHSIYAEIPDAGCGIEYLTKDSILLRVGEGTEARIQVKTKADEQLTLHHLKTLSTGLHVVSFFHNPNGKFGFCVDGTIYYVENVAGKAAMSSFNILPAPAWEMVWTGFGVNSSASVDLQWRSKEQ